MRPLETAAEESSNLGHKLCVVRLLLADDTFLSTSIAVKLARNSCGPCDFVTALEKWASGDKEGALLDLRDQKLVPAAVDPASVTPAAAVQAMDCACGAVGWL